MTPEDILKVEKDIVLTLKNIYDPEIPVNIYDLGLIYEIDYTPDGVANIRMTLTAPNCPMADMLVEDVNQQVAKVDGVKAVNVILTFDPVWDKSMMSNSTCSDMGAEQEHRMLNRLQAGAGTYACGGYLAGLGSLQRSEICTALLFSRLERKMRMVDALREEASENWNQTFYLLYFRTLGDRRNQEAYLSLARRVPYKVVLRERLAPRAVEAMFFGASGLLTLYPHDAYTLDLARDFEYLAAKYDIEPLDAGVWELDEIRPANHPVLRLAQAAEFFIQDEFVMERAMSCRTEEDIRRLFCIEASAYWRTHHIPGIASDEHPKRLGAFKANIIGINLVSVLQFAYGSVTGRETLRDSALTLLERLPAEDNRYMRNWRNTGVSIRNAFESQALLQLATEYCPAKRCTECPVGRRILQSISSTE